MKSVTYYSILILLLLTACQSDTKCRLPMVASPRVLVRAKGDFEEGTTLTIYGVGNEDSILYADKRLNPTILLPLRGDTTVTRYVFQTQTNTDTLTFFHTNHLQYVSLACGCTIHYLLDSVHGTTHMDSVEIINSAVETMVQDNVTLILLP